MGVWRTPWLLTSLVLFGCALVAPVNEFATPRHTARVLPGAPTPSPTRLSQRASLVYFGQLTDLHVTDEMSPMRIELVDPAPIGNWSYNAAWRPQEAMSAQTVDRAIRALNARATSAIASGDGTRAEMAFALVTGDLVDNLQQNEMRMAVEVLEGGRVDPFSGKSVDPANPCPGASLAEIQRIDAGAASRQYSGVQRYAQFPPTAPPDRRVTFYDPTESPPLEAVPNFPHYSFPLDPGLLARAQVPFEAVGLQVPYYVARGNHGTLVQGFYPPYVLEALYQMDALGLGARGCRKPFPTAELDPYAAPFEAGEITPDRQKAVIGAMQKMYAQAGAGDRAVFNFVSPDPARAVIESPSYPSWFEDTREAAGYGFVDRAEHIASEGFAHYYAFSPQPGLRLISLDTNSDAGGGPNGNLDAPQFRWLERELARLPEDTLAIVFAHHAIETLDYSVSDDCPSGATGCKSDPRSPGPVHLGCPLVAGTMNCGAPYVATTEPGNLRDLLLATPNVVLFVNGHTHVNAVASFSSGSGSGFWQVTTASIVDWPQQTRTLELMDNQDGTLSIFGTLVDLIADASIPAEGTLASAYDDAELRGIARALAAGDVQWREGPGRNAAGRIVDGINIDGDVELVLGDPR